MLVLPPCLCAHIGTAAPSPDPSKARHLHLIVECGIHGPCNPANLNCCCSIGAEWLRFNICAVLRCGHLLDTEVSILDSFLYPEVPRVNVFRSLSCPQSIRQRIRRRTVTSYSNLRWNSQILVHRSRIIQFDLLSPLRKTSASFHAQCCQALKRRSRFHSVVTSLSHQSRRALPGDCVSSKAAVREDCDLVNIFLSSISQRCFGLSHQISRCTFQLDKVEFTKFTHSLGQMFCCFSKIQSVLGQV